MHIRSEIFNHKMSRNRPARILSLLVNYVLDSRLAIILGMKLNLHSNIFVDFIKLCFKFEDRPKIFMDELN
jgi:hypothetical protein